MIGHERGLYRVNLSCEIKIYLGSTTRCSVKCAPHVKQSLGVSVDLEEEEAILRRQVDLDHEKLNRTTKSRQKHETTRLCSKNFTWKSYRSAG